MGAAARLSAWMDSIQNGYAVLAKRALNSQWCLPKLRGQSPATLIAGLGIGRVWDYLYGADWSGYYRSVYGYDITKQLVDLMRSADYWIRLKTPASSDLPPNITSHDASSHIRSTLGFWAGYKPAPTLFWFEAIPPSELIAQACPERTLGYYRYFTPEPAVANVALIGYICTRMLQPSICTVIINGPLANVKDGSFRGFSLGEKGIKEHAVLLILTNSINLLTLVCC